ASPPDRWAACRLHAHSPQAAKRSQAPVRASRTSRRLSSANSHRPSITRARARTKYGAPASPAAPPRPRVPRRHTLAPDPSRGSGRQCLLPCGTFAHRAVVGALLVDAAIVVLAASMPVVLERLRGLEHAGGDLGL